MNMVRMTAIRMVEEKKDGRNCWYDEVGEGDVMLMIIRRSPRFLL